MKILKEQVGLGYCQLPNTNTVICLYSLSLLFCCLMEARDLQKYTRFERRTENLFLIFFVRRKRTLLVILSSIFKG